MPLKGYKWNKQRLSVTYTCILEKSVFHSFETHVDVCVICICSSNVTANTGKIKESHLVNTVDFKRADFVYTKAKAALVVVKV